MKRCWGLLVAAFVCGPSFSAPRAPVEAAAKTREELRKKVEEAMEAEDLDKVTCQNYLFELAGAGEPLLATAWLDKLRKKGVPLETECYEAIIGAHCAMGLASQGEAVLEAHSAELAPVGQLPNSGCYSHLLQAFAKQGDLRKVNEYANKMKSAGHAVDSSSYDVAVQALAQGGQADAARRWLEEALREGLALSRESFLATVAALAKDARLAEAESLVTAMRKAQVEVDAETWGWLLLASSSSDSRARRKNSYTSSESIFREMLREGVVPDAFVLRALGKVIGAERRQELCRELGVELPRLKRRKNTKKLVELKQGRPYKDGWRDPTEYEDITDTYQVWLGDDEIYERVQMGARYWPGQKLFKPDKDCGTRRHHRPNDT